jgi:ankyrin repeat protein
VKLLVETGKADIDAENKLGHIALSRSIQYRNVDIMKRLVEGGAAVTGTRSIDQL